jgi:selenocysteine-specific translation elongation factor
MKHLAVGIFHDDALGRELGKKDTESDIVMFSRKLDGCIFTFMLSVEDKLSAKSQIVSSIDAAIVGFNGMTSELGETLVLLDSLGICQGVAVTSPFVTSDQIDAVTRNTTIESFIVGKREPLKILEVLKSCQPERDMNSPAAVMVDHSFSVKGVGEVILGFVRRGVVRKYDKLTLLPANKEVVVRSIQIQDEDYEEAEAGTRVGLAIKGSTVEEMKRGSILHASNGFETSTKLKLSLEKSRFYSGDVREGAFHATVGMQTVPISIAETSESSIVIESEKSIVYSPEDTFLLLDLNAKKMRIIGKATTATN